jgi:hypothetical protein
LERVKYLPACNNSASGHFVHVLLLPSIPSFPPSMPGRPVAAAPLPQIVVHYPGGRSAIYSQAFSQSLAGVRMTPKMFAIQTTAQLPWLRFTTT